MSRTKGHSSKTVNERNAYVNYIKKQDYEPTKDEAFDFNDSNNKDTDYSIQNSKKLSRLTIWEQIQKHLENNWIKWVFAGVALVIGYLVFTSKISISTIETKLERTEKDIEVINKNVEEIKGTNNQQDLKIQKNEITIENYKEKKTNDEKEK